MTPSGPDTAAPRREARFAWLHQLVTNPLGCTGLVMVILIVVSAIGADWIAPYDYKALDVKARFSGPTMAHYFGTDNLGRDTFSRTLYGGRVALSVALIAVSLSLVIGVLLGILAGYGPRRLDNFLLLVFDSVRSFPTIMFALAVITVVGPSINTVIGVVVVTSVPGYARIARTQTLALKNTEFILAERALGAGTGRVMFSHIVPNVIAPLLILASMDIPVVITIEAGLSFLGLGVKPPTPSWGSILSDGYSFIRDTPWMVVAGGIPLILTTLGFTFLGGSAAGRLRPQAQEGRLMRAGRESVLEVRDLAVEFRTRRGVVRALRHVDLSVARNKVVGIVGESGCGKSTLINTVLRLLAPNATVSSGSVYFQGDDVLQMSEDALNGLRGQMVSVVFQDPMTALNPVISVGRQMTDILYRERRPMAEKRARATEMLRLVGIPDASHRLDDYPHQFSGGMRQRICIAMALMMNPALLIADEPTTALDVTLEAQVIHLIRELRKRFECSILFVSHNLGLIAELCDEVVVMYAGEVVEQGEVRDLFHNARHPYTRMLLECDPARIRDVRPELPTIPGTVPDLIDLPAGCIFSPRCPHSFDECTRHAPETYEVHPQHSARCFLLRDG